jgi:FkbM family methyltransferase
VKRRICQVIFGKYCESILYSGKPRGFIWKSIALPKPIKFHLAIEDDYFSLFAKGIETSWEVETLTKWTEIAKTSDIIIDVGAYFGLFTNAAVLVDGPKLVIAVEPNEITYNKLIQHLHLNQTTDRVRTENIAISNRDGDQLVMVPKGRATSSGAQLQDSSLRNMDELWEIANSVRTTNLDSLLKPEEYSRVTQIKIDTEGYELKVLEGASQILSSSKPHLFIEILNLDSLSGCINFLDGFGYGIPIPLDGFNLSSQNHDGVLDQTLARNYLFSQAK